MAKLLVVDDELEMCESPSEALANPGYSVETCQTGTAAIELFRRERADLVFCDLKLPGLDGFEVLGALKGIDPWATVIIVTGYGSVETATHALRLGAYDFVEKPFTVAQIQQVANRALEHRRQLRELTLLQGKPGSATDLPTRLTELEQLKADFLTLVIQELRTPFRLLSEALSLAQEGFYGSWADPLKEQFLNRCRRIHTLLSRLLLGGLAFFLNHEHRVTAVSGDVRLGIEQVLEEARPRCEERHLTLGVLLPDSPVVGLTDSEKIACIARELIDNAINSTPPGGLIEVRLTCQDSKGFQIQIKDTGRGITDEEKGWLFTQHGQRVSLGLPLVQHYVDLLNGTIQLESQLGQGSCFTVRLPWWKDAS